MPVSRTISVWLRRVPTGIDKVKYAGENQAGWEETRRVYEDNLRLEAKIPGGWRENIGYLPPLDTTGVHRFCDGVHGVHGVHHSDADTAEITKKIVQLLSRLEGEANGDVADSTTRHHRGDRKVPTKEREKTIAMGHKPSNHKEQKWYKAAITAPGNPML